MKLCDLHVHSHFSDGTLSPKEVLELAKNKGLTAVALTDHNTIEGLESFLSESKELGVEGIAGVEISSVYNEAELHILALFIDKEHFDKVKDFLFEIKRRKEASNVLLAKNLSKEGYKIDYERIRANAVGSLNRVNFANELIKNGYITSIKEGLETILSEEYGLYVPPKRYTAFEVIEFIRSIGAIPVLAHPLLRLSRQELPPFIEQAKNYGLMAMETRYSTYTQEEQAFSIEIAKKYNLLESGGSDFHGENKPDIKIGEGEGGLVVPYELVEIMKNYMAKNKGEL